MQDLGIPVVEDCGILHAMTVAEAHAYAKLPQGGGTVIPFYTMSFKRNQFKIDKRDP